MGPRPSDKVTIIITGPTGVGKTAASLGLERSLPIEIINSDVGQLYTPLALGTAKPDWKNASVPHHLFDCCDDPRNISAADYRERALETVAAIRKRGKVPVFVGGTLFYLHSLFFPPRVLASRVPASDAKPDSDLGSLTAHELWGELNRIDPNRAAMLHPHDRYRVMRAIEIWRETGGLPSHATPGFTMDPRLGKVLIIFLHRNREELVAMIDERTDAMMAMGWLDEVRGLDESWKKFLKHKRLIGYDTLIDLEAGRLHPEEAVDRIKQQTRAYAKRQMTFWRRMKRMLLAHDEASSKCDRRIEVIELNLTLSSFDLYLDHVISQLHSLIEQ